MDETFANEIRRPYRLARACRSSYTLKNIDISLKTLKTLIIAVQCCRTQLTRLAWSQPPPGIPQPHFVCFTCLDILPAAMDILSDPYGKWGIFIRRIDRFFCPSSTSRDDSKFHSLQPTSLATYMFTIPLVSEKATTIYGSLGMLS